MCSLDGRSWTNTASLGRGNEGEQGMALKPATNPDVEAASIELTIDGKTVTAKDGVSLYDVI